MISGKNGLGATGTILEAGGGWCEQALGALTKKQRDLLMAFVRQGTVQSACEATGIRRSVHYYWMSKVPGYKQAFKRLRKLQDWLVEQTAFERALDGWDEPVFHKGSIVGQVRKYDNQLLWKLLQSRKRRYADNGKENLANRQSNRKGEILLQLPDNGRLVDENTGDQARTLENSSS